MRFIKLYSKKFQEQLKKVKNPYGDKSASKQIIKVIKKINLNNILKKKFYDLSI
jgi:GDP/UDP-N,N'-diacetylbacillosamine 2-epimerase (hydrolysing)